MADEPEPDPGEWDEVPLDLLSAETSSTSVESTVSSTHSWPAAGLLIAVVIALSGWLVSSIVSNPAPPQPEALVSPDEDPTDTTIEPTTTTVSATTRRSPRVLDSSGPIDPESSLSLLTSVSGRLRVVDFATGDTLGLDQQGEPVVVVDDYLLLRVRESIAAVPLTDLEGDTIDLPVSFWGAVAPSDRPNTVWAQEAPDDITQPGTGRVVLVDLSTGEVLERLDPDDPAGQWSDGVSNGGTWPNLINGTGGGVYERLGGGFRQRAEGRLHAADADVALIETCDVDYRCELTWLDRTEWEPVEGRFVPDGTIGAYTMLAGGGRVIWYLDGLDFTSVTLLDVFTGDSLRLQQDFYGPQTIAIGPEGRWIAYHSWETGDLTVQTMDGSEQNLFSNFGREAPIVIVELP